MAANPQTGPWPEFILHSFSIANATNGSSFEMPFNGPWNRLLATVFPPDTVFEVTPQYIPPLASEEPIDFIALVIYVETSPVLIVDIRPLNLLPNYSNLEEADTQMRRWFRDCANGLRTPILHGVSAFGTKMAFYKYQQNTRRVEPARITRRQNVLNDTASCDLWSYDILQKEGANKFCAIVGEIKDLCASI